MIDIKEIDDVQYKFTELGKSIADLTLKHSKLMDEVHEVLNDNFGLLIKELASNDALLSKSINRTRELSNMSSGHVGRVSKLFTDMEGKISHSFGAMERSITGSIDKFEKLVPDVHQVGGVKKGKKGFWGKVGVKAKRAGFREIGTIKMKITGLASKMYIPTPGKILGTAAMLIGYGYMEQDRIKREAGEVLNIMVTSFDSGAKGMVSKGTAFISNLQENMQKFMGIGKDEVQSVAKAFIDGGVGIEEMLRKTDINVAGVKDNLLTFTFALDKMFNLAGGESARRVVSIMEDYGKNLEGARKSLFNMMMIAKDSGIGTMQFMKNIEAAGESLKRYGFDIDDVVEISVKMQEKFEEMGVPRQFAGRQVAIGLQQLASSVGNMSDDWQAVIGELMGHGEGLEARQKMMESWTRVIKREAGSAGSPHELMGIISKVVMVALKASDQHEANARYILEKGAGMGFEGAKIAMMIDEALKKGDFEKAKEITRDNMNIFKKAFETEATQQSEFQRHMNTILKGMSKVGEGILGLIMNSLAYIILFFKSLPMLFNALFGKATKQEAMTFFFEMAHVQSSMDKSKAKVMAGVKQAFKGVKGLSKDFMGSTLSGLERAWGWDPNKKINVPESYDENVARSVAPMIIPIPITPTGFDKEYDVLSSHLEGGQEDIGWVGGKIMLVSKGLDNQGNIRMSLKGNCPKCGLIFGEGIMQDSSRIALESKFGKFSEKDVEALSRMLHTEVGDINVGNQVEAAGVAWTALNRLADPKKRYGASLHDVIVGKSGKYGKQSGGDRPYGTARGATSASQKFARDILSGNIADPTHGATHFYHTAPKRKFGGKKDQALPPYTRGMTNVFNTEYGTGPDRYARFYKHGGEEAAEADKMDAHFREKLRDKKTPQVMEKTEDSLAGTVFE